MVAPQMNTMQRSQLEQSRTAISRQLLAFNQNAHNFAAYMATLTDPVLLAAPYSFTADELYAIRRFAEISNNLATIAEDGGTLSPEDATLLMTLVANAAGVWLVNPNSQGAY